MEQKITQVKFKKEIESKSISVVCTVSDLSDSLWICNFGNISLLDIAYFVVDLFNSDLLNASKLTLHVSSGKKFSVEKSTENTFTHYLEELSSQINF